VNALEFLFLVVAPLIGIGLALWLRSKTPPTGFLLWPVTVPTAACVAVVLAVAAGANDLAAALLLAVCPIASTLLALTSAAVRRRPWALVLAIPVLYAVAAIVAVNVGLDLELINL